MKQKSSCFGSKDIDFQQFRQMQMSQEVTRELPTGEICAEVQGCSHLAFWCFLSTEINMAWQHSFVYTQALAVQGTARHCKALQGTARHQQ